MFTNFELKRRDYKAIEVELNGRIADRVVVNASYTWSQAKGTNPGQGERSIWTSNWGSAYEFSIFGDRPDVPESAPEKELYDYLYSGLGGRGVGDEGWYGFLPYSVDHMAKLLVIFQAPWGMMLSLGGEFLSGYHWEKRGLIVGYADYSAFIEGRGARTTPAHAYLDWLPKKSSPSAAEKSLDWASMSIIFSTAKSPFRISRRTSISSARFGDDSSRAGCSSK